MSRASYGHTRIVNLPFEQAIEKTKEALKAQGFGVLAEIPIHKALKEKLNVDYPRYVILGACNPQLAYKALQSEPELGLLLPCNVIVYATDEGTRVSAIDPDIMLGMIDNPVLTEVAHEVRTRLERVLERI